MHRRVRTAQRQAVVDDRFGEPLLGAEVVAGEPATGAGDLFDPGGGQCPVAFLPR